jgi:hypothetical protein
MARIKKSNNLITKVERLALKILHFSDTHLGFNDLEIVNESGNKIGSYF